MAFGFLGPVAALGLVVICLVACVTDGPRRVESYAPIDAADRLDDWLYLPELLYGLFLALVIALGSGPLSIDALLF